MTNCYQPREDTELETDNSAHAYEPDFPPPEEAELNELKESAKRHFDKDKADKARLKLQELELNNQDELIKFVQDPKTIAKAVEGSMEKRLKVMNKDLDLNERIYRYSIEISKLSAAHHAGKGKGLLSEKLEAMATQLTQAILATHTPNQKIVEALNSTANPFRTDDEDMPKSKIIRRQEKRRGFERARRVFINKLNLGETK